MVVFVSRLSIEDPYFQMYASRGRPLTKGQIESLLKLHTRGYSHQGVVFEALCSVLEFTSQALRVADPIYYGDLMSLFPNTCIGGDIRVRFETGLLMTICRRLTKIVNPQTKRITYQNLCDAILDNPEFPILRALMFVSVENLPPTAGVPIVKMHQSPPRVPIVKMHQSPPRVPIVKIPQSSPRVPIVKITQSPPKTGSFKMPHSPPQAPMVKMPQDPPRAPMVKMRQSPPKTGSFKMPQRPRVVVAQLGIGSPQIRYPQSPPRILSPQSPILSPQSPPRILSPQSSPRILSPQSPSRSPSLHSGSTPRAGSGSPSDMRVFPNGIPPKAPLVRSPDYTRARQSSPSSPAPTGLLAKQASPTGGDDLEPLTGHNSKFEHNAFGYFGYPSESDAPPTGKDPSFDEAKSETYELRDFNGILPGSVRRWSPPPTGGISPTRQGSIPHGGWTPLHSVYGVTSPRPITSYPTSRAGSPITLNDIDMQGY